MEKLSPKSRANREFLNLIKLKKGRRGNKEIASPSAINKITLQFTLKGYLLHPQLYSTFSGVIRGKGWRLPVRAIQEKEGQFIYIWWNLVLVSF
jgi:hypothetical protein